jgi:dinuclear metal center YbgI/SA1388 family protein
MLMKGRAVMAAIAMHELIQYVDETINPKPIEDYCHNGLQLEGRREVSRLITGVTLCAEVITSAVEWGADAILVHHGIFWKGDALRLGGMRRERLKLLLQHDIAVIGYHLPLDFHPTYGNNALIARGLGLDGETLLGRSGVLVASSPQPVPLSELKVRLAALVGQDVDVAEGDGRPIKSIGICSGGAQKFLGLAIESGCDAFITGEKSIDCYHSARESGVAFLAAGHHATERFGVRALGEHLAERFGIEHRFVDLPNPF